MIRLALAALALAASASVAMAATALIRGAASFDAETPPPPGSTLEVELLDLDAATPAGQRRAEASVPVRRRGSVAFVISYDPTAIDPGHRHVLAARLVEGKRTLFRADPFPILTAGAGNVAVIPMVSLEARKPAAPADPAVLAGTWTAEEIGGEPRSPGVASFVTLSPDGTLRGRGGCNSFSGSYEIAGGVLQGRPGRRHPPRLPAGGDGPGGAVLRRAGGGARLPHGARAARAHRRRGQARRPPRPAGVTS